MAKWADRVLRATGKWVLVALVLGMALRAGAEEPRYFAIRHARIVPVSGPEIKNGTVVIANGLIVAVGENVSIPPEAWVIEGKGLRVYPGFINALSDLGLGPPAPAGPGGGGGGAGRGQPQQAQQVSRGPEDRPASTPWTDAADELKVEDKRIETWRDGGFTSALAAPMTGIFPGQGAVINLAGDRPSAMVVSAPSALLITLQPARGFANFPAGSGLYLDAGYLYEGTDRRLAQSDRCGAWRWRTYHHSTLACRSHFACGVPTRRQGAGVVFRYRSEIKDHIGNGLRGRVRAARAG